MASIRADSLATVIAPSTLPLLLLLPSTLLYILCSKPRPSLYISRLYICSYITFSRQERRYRQRFNRFTRRKRNLTKKKERRGVLALQEQRLRLHIFQHLCTLSHILLLSDLSATSTTVISIRTNFFACLLVGERGGVHSRSDRFERFTTTTVRNLIPHSTPRFDIVNCFHRRSVLSSRFDYATVGASLRRRPGYTPTLCKGFVRLLSLERNHCSSPVIVNTPSSGLCLHIDCTGKGVQLCYDRL